MSRPWVFPLVPSLHSRSGPETSVYSSHVVGLWTRSGLSEEDRESGRFPVGCPVPVPVPVRRLSESGTTLTPTTPRSAVPVSVCPTSRRATPPLATGRASSRSTVPTSSGRTTPSGATRDTGVSRTTGRDDKTFVRRVQSVQCDERDGGEWEPRATLRPGTKGLLRSVKVRKLRLRTFHLFQVHLNRDE